MSFMNLPFRRPTAEGLAIAGRHVLIALTIAAALVLVDLIPPSMAILIASGVFIGAISSACGIDLREQGWRALAFMFILSFILGSLFYFGNCHWAFSFLKVK